MKVRRVKVSGGAFNKLCAPQEPYTGPKPDKLDLLIHNKVRGSKRKLVQKSCKLKSIKTNKNKNESFTSVAL